MSSPLAIAGVTAVLQHFMGIVYNSPGSVLGSVLVSAVAPDVVQSNLGSGNNSQLQVNLFLHQVTPNVGWRNMDLPRLAGNGTTPLESQPLALDLHYLLTAYATEDSQAEALLSLGVFLLHQNPVFARSAIRAALLSLPPSYPPAYAAALKASGLADQIEMIKVTPSTMNREELAWLWTALKADYRPTFPFQISVVLIEPQTAATMALPVLSRNIIAKPGPPPLLLETQFAMGQTAAAQGDTVTVAGRALAGANRISLSNPRLGINYPPFAPVSATSSLLTFKVPTDPGNLPAGVYNLSAQFTDTVSNAVILSTNTIAFPIAPTVSGTPTPTNNAAGTLISLNCAPDVRPSQAVSLAMGSNSAPAQLFDTQTNALSFQFTALSGKFLVRLRVDGVDSPVSVDWNAKPPVFTNPFVTI
jgi:Pvc16 N-terminal domain